MKGKAREEIVKDCEPVIQAFQDLGWVFVKTVHNALPADKANLHLWRFAAGLVDMADCDYVIFLKGWRDALGCRLEHDICEAFGVKTIELD